MQVSTPNQSQRKAAKVAGFAFLFAMAIVVLANYGVTFRLIVPDAAETARNIIANQTLFRLNIVGNLIYLVTVIAMFTSLYVILKPVNRNLALVAAFCRLVYALMWGIIALNIFGALSLLDNATYLSAFETDQLQALARLQLKSSMDAYYVGLPFWTLASTVCSYLWFKSGYVPRALAIFGMIASAWGVFCAFAYLISPNFQNTVHPGWFDMPLVIFEMALGVWLLFKGLRPAGLAQPNLTNQEKL
ncbi:DUF4386 domain-containing protein [Candidatus Neomarinimicrobiota bacterium]